jgi:parallel beta-helix repeat protein
LSLFIIFPHPLISEKLTGVFTDFLQGSYGLVFTEDLTAPAFGNTISANGRFGIEIWNAASYNSIYENTVEVSSYGIWIGMASNNSIYHNNFINNIYHVSTYGSENTWDNGYPSGGNYWGGYNGSDTKSGGHQNQTDSDGIGDTPLVFDGTNKDNYPLMGPLAVFVAGTWNGTTYSVEISSNSTISGFAFSVEQKEISFNVTGTSSTVGFCRVSIPKALLGEPFTVWIGTDPVTPTIASDGTHYFLYFTYDHSTQTITIQGTSVIPENLLAMILSMLIFLAAVAVTLRNKRFSRKPQV